jgi:hypothetical protein
LGRFWGEFVGVRLHPRLSVKRSLAAPAAFGHSSVTQKAHVSIGARGWDVRFPPPRCQCLDEKPATSLMRSVET